MKFNFCLFVIIIFTTLICSKGQINTAKRSRSGKFNRLFANMSQECLKENRVTAERVLVIYTLSTNDRDAKCYVSCMLLRFNVTNEHGDYNDQALSKFMKKPSTNETSVGMKNVIEKCKNEDDKDRCEKAVKFTKCIYNHKNEFGASNNATSSYRRRPMIPFGRHPGGWSIL